jgi:polysaccharide biosynthesis/export protein
MRHLLVLGFLGCLIAPMESAFAATLESASETAASAEATAVPMANADANVPFEMAAPSEPVTTTPAPVMEPLRTPMPPQAAASSSNDGLSAGVSLTRYEYKLGSGDELDLNVLYEPELSQTRLLVQPDGHISIQGVGVINVNQMTVEEATAIVTDRLRALLKNPLVTLTLTRPRPGTVYLAGAVQKPGMFQITSTAQQNSGVNIQGQDPVIRTDLRISNILAIAGGVNMNADLTKVEVRHVRTGKVERVNLWDVLKGENTLQDVLVSSGDTLFVPSTSEITLDDKDFQTLLSSSIGPKAFPVRVLGEAKQPGVYYVDGQSPFLTSAIAKAGGYALSADMSKLIVRRFTAENQFTDLTVTPAQVDLTLRPNDVVLVLENGSYKSGRYSQQVANVLSPFQTVSSVASAVAQVFGLGGWRRLP